MNDSERDSPYRLVSFLVGPRPVALVLALVFALALVDVVVRVYARRLVARPDFRVHAMRLSLLDDLLADRARAGTPLLALIGDSTAAGAMVLPDAGTPAAMFMRGVGERSGGRITGVALTVPGARPADYLFLARRLEGLPVRGIFITLNYETFSPPQLAVSLRYRTVPRALARVDGVDVLAQVLSRRERFEARFGGGVGSIWATFRHRAVLTHALLGGEPRAWMRGAYLRSAAAMRGTYVAVDPARSWRAMEYGAAELAHFKRMYDFDYVDPDAYNVRLLRLLCRTLHETKREVVFYVTPINGEMIDEQEMMRREWFEQNVAFLQNIPRSFGFETQDLSALVPGEEFIDAHHMLPAGNARLTERLLKIAARKRWLAPPEGN